MCFVKFANKNLFQPITNSRPTENTELYEGTIMQELDVFFSSYDSFAEINSKVIIVVS